MKLKKRFYTKKKKKPKKRKYVWLSRIGIFGQQKNIYVKYDLKFEAIVKKSDIMCLQK